MDSLFQNKTFRGCIGLIGFLIAGVCVSCFAMELVIIEVENPKENLAGTVGIYGCLLVTGVFGAALCWYGYEGVFGEGEKLTGRIEEQLLEAAKAHDGRLTVAQVAAETDLTMSDAQPVLSELAEEGLIRMEVDVDGDQVYVFPGLQESEQTFDERQFEERLSEAIARQKGGS